MPLLQQSDGENMHLECGGIWTLNLLIMSLLP